MLMDGLAEADSIPGEVDVAIQRVQLDDLGYIAFLLGFDSVRINIRDREIDATSRHANIYTSTLPGVGKVARFEGDIFAVHKQIAIGYPKAIQNNSAMVLGSLVFDGRFVSSSFHCPIDLVVEALQGRIREKDFGRRLQNSLRDSGRPKTGWICSEADMYEETRVSTRVSRGGLVSCLEFLHLSSADVV
jgi:hypothetical protein